MPVLLAGSASRTLASAVATRLGVGLGDCRSARLPGGELDVAVRAPVRGLRVYVVQSTRSAEDLLELLLIGDACRRADAARVTAVLPYLGYARQDHRRSEGEPLAARVVADLIGRERFDGCIAVDLHSPAIEGFFGVPVTQLSATPLLVQAAAAGADLVVAPDLGAMKLAQRYARALSLPLAVVRKGARDDEVGARALVGAWRGRAPLIVDDMIVTGATVEGAVAALREADCADEIRVAATHGLFTEGAVERLSSLPIRRVVVTDTLGAGAGRSDRMATVSVAGLLAEEIRRREAFDE